MSRHDLARHNLADLTPSSLLLALPVGGSRSTMPLKHPAQVPEAAAGFAHVEAVHELCRPMGPDAPCEFPSHPVRDRRRCLRRDSRMALACPTAARHQRKGAQSEARRANSPSKVIAIRYIKPRRLIAARLHTPLGSAVPPDSALTERYLKHART